MLGRRRRGAREVDPFVDLVLEAVREAGHDGHVELDVDAGTIDLGAAGVMDAASTLDAARSKEARKARSSIAAAVRRHLWRQGLPAPWDVVDDPEERVEVGMLLDELERRPRFPSAAERLGRRARHLGLPVADELLERALDIRVGVARSAGPDDPVMALQA